MPQFDSVKAGIGDLTDFMMHRQVTGDDIRAQQSPLCNLHCFKRIPQGGGAELSTMAVKLRPPKNLLGRIPCCG
jgi:hypothetical protein